MKLAVSKLCLWTIPFLLFTACTAGKKLTPNKENTGGNYDLSPISQAPINATSSPTQPTTASVPVTQILPPPLFLPPFVGDSPVAITPLLSGNDVSYEGTSVETTFINSSSMIINITGYVRATYYSSTQTSNAGVNAAISIDGVPCAYNQEFEAFSGSITFFSSVRCLKTLAPGNHVLRVFDASAFAYPHMGSYFSRLQFVALNAPGSGLPTPVIASNEVKANASNAETIFVTSVPVIINVSGYVRGTYYSSTQTSNAGVNATISIDGVACHSHFDFEGSSSSITFHSNSDCIRRVEPGTHSIRVFDSVAGAYPNMGAYQSQLQYVALDASPPPPSPGVGFNEINSANTSVEATFTTSKPVVVSFSGFAKGSYYSTTLTSNAGVNAVLLINGVACASDESFEAYSSSITFNTNVKCITRLPAGTHHFRLADSYAGAYPNMGSYVTRLQYMVLSPR